MKNFLSIGAGPGIGYATAERFAKEGYRVLLAARNKDKTSKLVERLTSQGFEAHAYTVDASVESEVATLISHVEMHHGAVEVMHYNAANLRNATLAAQPLDTLVSDLAVNIGGALAAAKSILPGMADRKAGTILLTGGGFALAPQPEFLSLSIGKAGIRALAHGLFESSKAQGVHVASVTVATLVQPDSKEATEIAEAFWALHNQKPDSWSVEATYPGE
ncbi:SDR family NAD(P)-dependent oxidoreductase [Pseudomonas sp. SIMBA_077]